MENAYRMRVAAVLRGPINLLSAYKALIDKFGPNADAAADYVINNRVYPRSRQASSPVDVGEPPEKLFGFPLDKDPKVDPEKAEERAKLFEGMKGAPPKPVSLEDAADTVGVGFMPNEVVVDLYVKHLRGFESEGEEAREEHLDTFLKKVSNLPEHELPGGKKYRQLFKPEGIKRMDLGVLRREFIPKTQAMTDTGRIVRVLGDLIFKASFIPEYKAMYAKLSKERQTAKVASVVLLYLGSLR